MSQRMNIFAFNWDDTELIKAFDRGVTLKANDYVEEDSDDKEGSTKKPEVWSIGDHCRALYKDDLQFYEAQIIEINGDQCTIDFIGYDEEAVVKLKGLRNSLGKKEIERQRKKAESGSIWWIGDNCRALYSGDNSWYEAKIIEINGDQCTIEFIGYYEEAEVELSSLRLSLGEKEIKMQRKKAGSGSIDEASSADETKNHFSATQSPHSNSKRGHRRHNESRMLDQSNYSTVENSFHHAYPMVRYSEVLSNSVPPTVSPCVEIHNPSLRSMMTAWYMAGYYTALNQVQKRSPQPHCSCYHCCCRHHQ